VRYRRAANIHPDFSVVTDLFDDNPIWEEEFALGPNVELN